MKNLLLGILVITAFTLNSIAQAPVVPAKQLSREGAAECFAGKAWKTKPGRSFKEFTVIDDNRYVVRLNANSEDEFEVFDTNLVVTESYTWEDARYKRGADMDLISFNGKYYKVTTSVDRENKTNKVFIAGWNLGEGMAEDSTELCTIDRESEYYEYFNKAFVGAKVNRAGNVMILYLKLPDQNNPNGARSPKLRFMAFDPSFRMLWAQDLDFYDREGKINEGGKGWFSESNGNVLVANSGSTYVWGEIDRGSGDEGRYKLKMFKLNADGVATATSSKIRGEESKIIATEDHLVMIGTFGQYGLQQKSGAILGGEEGLKLFRWNGETEQPSVKEILFGLNHLSNNKPDKTRKQLEKLDGKGIPMLSEHLKLQDLILLEDNTMILSAQNANVHKEVATNGFTTYTHSGGDIHLFHLSDKNTILWSQQIPVNQVNKDGVGVGFGMKVWNNTAYVFFNDDFANLEKEWSTEKNPAKWTGKDDHAVAYVAIDINDHDKDQKRMQYWKSRSAGITMQPAMFHSDRTKDYGLLFLEGGTGKQRLLRLEFE